MLTGGFLKSISLVISGLFSRKPTGCLIWDRLFTLSLSVLNCKMEIIYIQDCCGIKYGR